jgi:predicted ester cyclase
MALTSRCPSSSLRPGDDQLATRRRCPRQATVAAADVMTTPVELVTRLVDDVMNENHLDQLDQLCAPALAAKLRTAFSQFRAAFPDWHQQIVETITDGQTVVARMRCAGTHHGTWQGLAPTGRSMRIDEVYFFRVRDHQITGLWGLEDTWTRMRQLAGDDSTLGELGSLSDPTRPQEAR